ncbi:MAG TPA: hypothetical protein VKX17_25995 [Planctomycetota bacterium]|nr:hypothetical protein [Planctomycetota bacterium]
MPRAAYDEATKAAIKKAALDARKAGKTWKDAHAAAQAAGYQGSQQGIIKLLRTETKAKPGRKPGRPAGSKNKKKPGRPKGSGVSTPTSDISQLIDKLVKGRIQEALDKAIAVLKSAVS